MTQDLKYRMQQHEAAPPASAWEAIRERLADDALYGPLQAKVYPAQTEPPAPAWEAIRERLESDSRHAVLQQKLAPAQIPPPAAAWENLQAWLNQENSAQIIAPQDSKRQQIKSTRTEPRLLFRRLLAAAVLAALVLSAWLLLRSGAGQPEFAGSKTVGAKPLPVTAPPSAPIMLPDAGTSLVPPDHSANSPLGKDPQNQAGVPAQENVSRSLLAGISDGKGVELGEADLNYAALEPDRPHPAAAINIFAPPIRDGQGAVIQDMDALSHQGNYLLITGPNGQLARISSKFAGMIAYLNSNDSDTEEYLDRVIRESSIWKKRFSEWRDKIRESAFTPAGVNFLDILSLKELLEEKP